MQQCSRPIVVVLRCGAARQPLGWWRLPPQAPPLRRHLSLSGRGSAGRRGTEPPQAPRYTLHAATGRLLRAGAICGGLGLAVFGVGRVSLYERLKAADASGGWSLNGRQWRQQPLHVYALIAANVAVFLAWRVPAAQQLLLRCAMLWPDRLGPVSLVGSMFSHQHWLHLLVNMCVLHSFAPPLTAQLGSPEEFLCLYLCSGLLSGLLHAVAVPALPCLGASGCLFGLFAYTAISRPDAQVGLVLISDLLPGLHFRAYNAFLAMVAFDVAGMCGLFKLGLAHAAHLGGSAFGASYATSLRHWLWLRWGDLALGCWLHAKRLAGK